MSEFDLVLDSFQLERLQDNLFQSRSPAIGWRRIYGGLLLAHAVRAAQLSLDTDKTIHSLHGNFLRPGSTNEPMLLEIERLLDGRSLAQRRLTIRQSGKPVFIANISFRAAADGLYFAPPMPTAPIPEDLDDEVSICAQYREKLSENAIKYLDRRKVFEIRPVDPAQFLFAHGDTMAPMLVWYRLRSDRVSCPEMDPALMVYLSDMPVLNASLRPHGLNFFDTGLTMASLDHSIWQHAKPDWSNWLLATHESLATEAGMGLGHVRFYNRSGQLCATVSQQGFIRQANE